MTLGYKIGAAVMLQLGSFQFGISTAAYQNLQRSVEWRWPAQERFGKGPVLQHVGPGDDTITLPGVVYPEWRGGLNQIDNLRALAAEGKPQQLVDGRGNVLGRWVIERVEENQAVFADAGVPRRQEFTASLRRYFDEFDR